MELFRGYVPTKDKKSLIPFKNCVPLESVQNCSEYAGVLAEGVVLIDIDDYEQSEIMMDIVEEKQINCIVYETSRGKHFFFKNQRADGTPIVEKCGTSATGTKIACGLAADVKVGLKNSYAVLKYQNKCREIIWGYEEDAIVDPLPSFFTPLKTEMDFLNMKVGDGRNQSLFNYILTLQSQDFSKDEARETIRMINDFVLKEKLSESEIETILRDDAFKKPIFFKGKTFLFNKFATYLKNNNSIVKINDQLHIYKDGVYVNGYKKIEAEMIRLIPDLNKAKRTEVLSYVDILIGDSVKPSDANFIAFNNGIYNIMTDELESFNPSKIITNKIPWDYNPDAYCELVDRTLNKMACFDKDIRLLLEEAIGYCFYRRNELRKFFILIGERQNGKSTYLAMVENVLGQENISSLDLRELGAQFKTAELFGKLANIGDDIEDEFIPNPAILKKLTSGNPVNAEKKGQDPFDFSNYSKLLFSANNIPRIKDKTGAVMSRLIIVPFNATFTKEDPDYDPYIKYKLIQPEAAEYLVKLGVDALKRILENKAFTKSKAVDIQLTEYEKNNNPILLFFEEEPKIENEPTSTTYRKYHEFCSANNFNPMSNIEFSKQVKRHYGFEIVDKKIAGKKYRVFVKKES